MRLEDLASLAIAGAITLGIVYVWTHEKQIVEAVSNLQKIVEESVVKPVQHIVQHPEDVGKVVEGAIEWAKKATESVAEAVHKEVVEPVVK